MTLAHTVSDPLIESGYAGIAIEPPESGDLHVVVPLPRGVLVAVMDGLGHGPEAALATRVARGALEAYAHEPIAEVVRRCHDALRGTRGVVMSLAVLDASTSTLTWMGVGNVEGALLRANASAASNEAISTTGGVLGYRLPSLRSASLPVAPGDTLLMATDGIRDGFLEGIDLTRPPQEVAETILARSCRGSDDALVFVARYLGAPP
jgi:serine phosphatase RsbU (regulator of sigma subunit)